jgi:hypothetical protein
MFAASLPKRETGHDALPVCLGTENPHRLVSLWDIVNQFQAIEICVQMGNFATTEAQFVRGDYSGEHFGRNQIIANLLAHIIHVSRAIEEAGLTHDVQLFNAMQKRIAEGRLDDSALASEARNAKAILLEALRKLQFLYVATDRIGYLDQDALFGDHVKASFPSAVFDIHESGNCIAAECPTAAVFHLMRSIEWGLRALGTDLGIRRLRSRNKKTGKVKYTPLPWAQWEDIINQIKTRIAARIIRVQRGPKKQECQEFYNPAVDNIERFKDAYRNHVMHNRREYSRSEAFAIFDQVQHFMTRLATRLSEC